MTPNLLLITQKALSPHKWFKSPKLERPARETVSWLDGPVPGLYEYIPGRGRYLVATLKDTLPEKIAQDNPLSVHRSSLSLMYDKLKHPILITYSRALEEWFLEPDFQSRKRQGLIKNENGKYVAVGFFRTDDHGGIAWIQCWDERGAFIPGPYQKWCIDTDTNQFRRMRHRDDSVYMSSSKSVSDHNIESHSQSPASTGHHGSPIVGSDSSLSFYSPRRSRRQTDSQQNSPQGNDDDDGAAKGANAANTPDATGTQ